jgi:catechol 2,3-dioxygenase-like lactoylglutathione lyase family enzyme
MLDDARVEAIITTSKLSRARSFYEDTLGLRPSGEHTPGLDVVYECGQATRLLVEETPHPLTPARIAAHFIVDDVRAAVRELRGRGVVFEEYDLPELKTVDGVARVGELDFAWFKDPDLNVIGIHS